MKKVFKKGIHTVTLTPRGENFDDVDDRNIMVNITGGNNNMHSYWLEGLMEVLLDVDDYLNTQDKVMANGKRCGYSFKRENFLPEEGDIIPVAVNGDIIVEQFKGDLNKKPRPQYVIRNVLHEWHKELGRWIQVKLPEPELNAPV